MSYTDVSINWQNSQNSEGIDYFSLYGGITNICTDDYGNMYATCYSVSYLTACLIIKLEIQTYLDKTKYWNAYKISDTLTTGYGNNQSINGICVDNLGYLYYSVGNSKNLYLGGIYKISLTSYNLIASYGYDSSLINGVLNTPAGLVYYQNCIFIAMNCGSGNGFIGILTTNLELYNKPYLNAFVGSNQTSTVVAPWGIAINTNYYNYPSTNYVYYDASYADIGMLYVTCPGQSITIVQIWLTTNETNYTGCASDHIPGSPYYYNGESANIWNFNVGKSITSPYGSGVFYTNGYDNKPVDTRYPSCANYILEWSVGMPTVRCSYPSQDLLECNVGPSFAPYSAKPTRINYIGDIYSSTLTYNPYVPYPSLVFGNNNLLDSISSVSKLYSLVEAAPCFNYNTKILCLNAFGKEKYILVQDLKKGDLVKTYLHGYRKIDLIGKGNFTNDVNIWHNCMYKMEKTNENGLLEDLIVTGGHSILENGISDIEKENLKSLGITDFHQKIDDKYLSLACASPKFKKLENKDSYTFYHFALESEDGDKHFGVWANGILSESIQKNYFLKQNFKSI